MLIKTLSPLIRIPYVKENKWSEIKRFQTTKNQYAIIPTLALVLDFSLKNTLFNMALFVKIPVIRVIRPVRKAFVAKM